MNEKDRIRDMIKSLSIKYSGKTVNIQTNTGVCNDTEILEDYWLHITNVIGNPFDSLAELESKVHELLMRRDWSEVLEFSEDGQLIKYTANEDDYICIVSIVPESEMEQLELKAQCLADLDSRKKLAVENEAENRGLDMKLGGL